MAENLEQYIVVRNRKPFTASKVHESLDTAAAEAKRLARKEKDTFLVFELAGGARVEDPPVRWTRKREAPTTGHFDDGWQSDDTRAAALAAAAAYVSTDDLEMRVQSIHALLAGLHPGPQQRYALVLILSDRTQRVLAPSADVTQEAAQRVVAARADEIADLWAEIGWLKQVCQNLIAQLDRDQDTLKQRQPNVQLMDISEH